MRCHETKWTDDTRIGTTSLLGTARRGSTRAPPGMRYLSRTRGWAAPADMPEAMTQSPGESPLMIYTSSPDWRPYRTGTLWRIDHRDPVRAGIPERVVIKIWGL